MASCIRCRDGECIDYGIAYVTMFGGRVRSSCRVASLRLFRPAGSRNIASGTRATKSMYVWYEYFSSVPAGTRNVAVTKRVVAPCATTCHDAFAFCPGRVQFQQEVVRVPGVPLVVPTQVALGPSKQDPSVPLEANRGGPTMSTRTGNGVGATGGPRC